MRKFIPTAQPIQRNDGKTCCKANHCTHEYFKHREYDVPWWACYDNDCEEHQILKMKNEICPMVPRVTMKQAQKCPCLRLGCICNLSQQHDYHKGIIPLTMCTHRNCKIHKAEIEERFQRIPHELNEIHRQLNLNRVFTIQQVSSSDIEEHLRISVTIAGQEISAIIDSGANINYVNAQWCREQGIKSRPVGNRTIRAYDGRDIQENVRETTMPIEIEGKIQHQKFRLLKETGNDIAVLGLPWLKTCNPEIDWTKEEIKVGKVRDEIRRKEGVREPPVQRQTKPERKLSQENYTEKKGKQPLRETIDRKGYQDPRNNTESPYGTDSRTIPTPVQKSDYQEQLKEVKDKLPNELQDFADVFCKEK
jgi:gag-polyprotein putative aspartyl protease